MYSCEIYYFTGTGNSLYVAKKLQKELPDSNLISIMSCLSIKKFKSEARIIGFVFPIYMTSLPKPVREFIRKIEIDSAEYFFSITTSEGVFTLGNLCIDDELKKKGKYLNLAFDVTMIQNSPTGLKPGQAD